MAIRLNIGTLKEGSQQLDLFTDVKEIGVDEGLIKGDISLSIELFKATHQLDLKAKITGIMNLVCDRCLEKYELPFERDFEIVFVQKAEREEKINEDYIRSYSPYMKTIDITNDIREFILLSVPMRKVPARTDKGACSWCGKTDEYWKNLIMDKEN
jgi:uncharacterized protein